jgi:hypothetical protein
MKYLLAAIIISLFISISFIFTSDRLSYNNCMIQAKSNYISEKGSKHVAAQCRAFILEKIMVKN